VAGALAYVAGLGLNRERAQPRTIDPRRLHEPWAGFVRDALDAQLRYQRARGERGPEELRERLAALGARVGAAVGECWRLAVQGAELERLLAALEPLSELELRLVTLERIGPSSGADAGVAESLRRQLRSTERITAVRDDVHEHLAVLGLNLEQVVARAVELSFGTDEYGELGQLERRMDGLVADMEALRRVVDHSRATRPIE
jgi:hypothetical protein